MSYLFELKNKQIDAKGFLSKSVLYLKAKLGISVSDQAVDAAVAAEDLLTDGIEAVVKAYILAKVPYLPVAELAASAATGVLNHIDAAIAGAGNVIKAANDQPASAALPG